MTYRIIIPNFRFTLLNKLLEHWAVRARLKRQDRDFVWAYAKLANVAQAQSKRRVSLEVTYTGQQKEFDPDAPIKSCLDALVQVGLLVGDSAKWVEWGGVTQTRGEKSETVIVLEDIS